MTQCNKCPKRAAWKIYAESLGGSINYVQRNAFSCAEHKAEVTQNVLSETKRLARLVKFGEIQFKALAH